MNIGATIFVVGHRSMVGSAPVRRLRVGRYSELLTPTNAELGLLEQHAVHSFLASENPDYAARSLGRAVHQRGHWQVHRRAGHQPDDCLGQLHHGCQDQCAGADLQAGLRRPVEQQVGQHHQRTQFDVFFLSMRRMVSPLTLTRPCSRCAAGSSSMRVLRSLPAGGVVQARDVTRASASVSHWHGRPERATSNTATLISPLRATAPEKDLCAPT